MTTWDKAELVTLCKQKIENKRSEVKAAMSIAQDSILNDTKSSMGDKYETSREMAQQELNRLQQQLMLADQDIAVLESLNQETTTKVIPGAIVLTDQFNYFIAVSLGPLKIADRTIMVVSKESPIGKALMGKEIKTEITFNGKQIKIVAIA